MEANNAMYGILCKRRCIMIEGRYMRDQLFSHASHPKKSLTQNVFLLIFLNFFDLFLTKFYQMFEELVILVQ